MLGRMLAIEDELQVRGEYYFQRNAFPYRWCLHCGDWRRRQCVYARLCYAGAHNYCRCVCGLRQCDRGHCCRPWSLLLPLLLWYSMWLTLCRCPYTTRCVAVRRRSVIVLVRDNDHRHKRQQHDHGDHKQHSHTTRPHHTTPHHTSHWHTTPLLTRRSTAFVVSSGPGGRSRATAVG